MASALENTFALQLKLAGIPFERGVKGIVPGRRFEWDFRVKGLLIEVQGGIFRRKNGVNVPQGHSTGMGITRDCEKANLALLQGWPTMAITKAHIESGKALAWVQEYLKR